jgi:hypothetical protein
MSGAVIRGEIVERADGVPLFVEELTKAVVEAGDSGPKRRWALWHLLYTFSSPRSEVAVIPPVVLASCRF